jgi:putative DNA primase/helicase
MGKGEQKMRFEDFARMHGLILKDLIPNRWVATGTQDHPRSQNGRYKFLGTIGWVQNWATMDRPQTWKDGNGTLGNVREIIAKDNQERNKAHAEAAGKAKRILGETIRTTHPYLAKKGFPDESGNVWVKDGKRVLVVPMFVANRLVGLQLIDEEGTKKFLYGQRTKGASFIMDARGFPIFCEGYATALSIRAIMTALKLPYRIIVCFSAGNLQEVAGKVLGGCVVADNDSSEAGERAALKTGKPYWLSDASDEDFNDYHLRVGLFHASSSFRKYLFSTGLKLSV